MKKLHFFKNQVLYLKKLIITQKKSPKNMIKYIHKFGTLVYERDGKIPESNFTGRLY